MLNFKDLKIAVIGQGYVGLPLAIEFGKKYETIGFDINAKRIEELNERVDHTQEASKEQITKALKLSFSSALAAIKNCNIYIITVPTPIDVFKTPDLNPLKSATEMIGPMIKKGDIIIYESTVFPGCTEEVCVPLLEKESDLKFNEDFFCQ